VAVAAPALSDDAGAVVVTNLWVTLSGAAEVRARTAVVALSAEAAGDLAQRPLVDVSSGQGVVASLDAVDRAVLDLRAFDGKCLDLPRADAVGGKARLRSLVSCAVRRALGLPVAAGTAG